MGCEPRNLNPVQAEIHGTSPRSVIDGLARAINGGLGGVVALWREGELPLDDVRLEQTAVAFAADPVLACIGIQRALGSGDVLTLRDARPVAEGPVLGIVARAGDLALLTSLDDVDDPWEQVVSALGATPGTVRWCLVPGPPVAMRDHWSGRRGLEVPLMAGHDRVPLEEPARQSASLPGWVEIVNVRRGDGCVVPARRGFQRLAVGEQVEDVVALVESEASRSSVPLMVEGGPRPRIHTDRDAPGAECLGWLDPHGLPEGVALMAFHDPERGDDILGHAGQVPAGRVPGRLLGWGRTVPCGHRSGVTTGEDPRRRVVAGNDGFELAPYGVEGRSVVATVYSDGPRPGRSMLYAGHRGSLPVITGDPLEADLHDVKALGYVDDRHSSRLTPAKGRPTRAHVARSRVRRLVVRPRRLAGEPPRVLMVLPWLAVGGGDHFLRSLAIGLRAAGRRVWIATTFPADAWPSDNSAAFAPHVEAIHRLGDLTDGVSLETAVARLVHAHGIDCLFLCGGSQIYSGLRALRRVCPGLRVVDQLFNDIGHLDANRRHADQIDLTICAYRALADLVVDAYGEQADRVRLVYIGVDLARFRPVTPEERAVAKRRAGFDPGRPLWGFLGRLSEEKRLPDLIEALSKLDMGPTAPQVLIQGEGPGEEELRRALTGKEHLVEVRGFAPDALPVLQALDAYLLPSRTEGIPLAVMEAMACGAIPIATSVGGVPEVVQHGRTGYLAEPENPGSLARALRALARTSPERLEAMRIEGRRLLCQQMDAESMIDVYRRSL